MAKFENSIVLRVRERASRALRGINRLQERIEKRTKGINRESAKTERIIGRTERATRRLAAGLGRAGTRALHLTRNIAGALNPARALLRLAKGIASGFGKAANAARRAASAAGRAAGRGAVSVTRAGIVGAGAVLGGIIPAANSVTGDIGLTDARARASGLDYSQFDRLLKFLQIASGGQIDRDEGGELLAEFRNRLGEAGLEKQGATFDALKALAKFTGDAGFVKRVTDPTADLDSSLAEVIDAIRELAKTDPRQSQFLSEEIFGGTEGRYLNEIATLPEEFVRQAEELADKLKVDVSGSDVQNVRAYRLGLEGLRASFKASVNKAILRNLPAITKMIDNLSGALDKFATSGGADKIVQVMTGVTNTLASFLGDVSDPDAEAKTFLGGYAQKLIKNQLFQGVKGFVEAVVAIPGAIKDLVDRIGALLDRWSGAVTADTGPAASSKDFEPLAAVPRTSKGGGAEALAREVVDLEDQIATLKARADALAGTFRAGEVGGILDQIKALQDQLREARESYFLRQIEGGDTSPPAAREFLRSLERAAVEAEKIRSLRFTAEDGLANVINASMARRQEAEGGLIDGTNAMGAGAFAAGGALDVFAAKVARAGSVLDRLAGAGQAGRGIPPLGGETV